MTFDKLLAFIDLQHNRLLKQYGNESDEVKQMLGRAVKLNEEVGELCDEVLSFNSFQRQDKLEKLEKDNLSHEVADVIITTLLLAKTMKVDVKKSLEQKIEKINTRYIEK